MRRIVTPEHIDDPDVAPEIVRRSLAYLRWLNRWVGGIDAMLSHLKAWSHHWPRGRPVTLLDVGTGSGDLPVAAWEWARSAGFDLRVTGVDASGKVLDVARRHVGRRPGIDLVQADAFDLPGVFEGRSFDYVHAGLFIHHLDEDGVVRVLRIMNTIARAGVIWNDLMRSRTGLAVIRILTIGQPRPLRHDGAASVRAGFTRSEALDLARRAGLDWASYRENVMTHRFTLAGERPGAWPDPALPRERVSAGACA